MKQYDNLYTHAESKKEIDYYMDNMGDNVGLKKLPKSLIVTTLEELKELWDKGYVRGCEEAEAKARGGCGPISAPNFTEYITFKGIKNE